MLQAPANPDDLYGRQPAVHSAPQGKAKEKTSEKLGPGGVAFLALSLALSFGFCTYHYDQRAQAGEGSESWPTTGGVITSSGVAYVGSENYDSKVRYQYNVEGQTYTAGRIAFGHNTLGSLGNAKSDAKKYPVGKTVSVYYKPEDPAVAVLEPGAPARPENGSPWASSGQS